MATVPFNPVKVLKLNRYNGGWTKSVTGLDKSHADGFSIRGEFMRKDSVDIYTVGGIYLDCNISGSRKNHHHTYTLFRVVDEGHADVLFVEDSNSKDWAVNLWPAIEDAFSQQLPGPLAKFSSEELIAELVSRGVQI